MQQYVDVLCREIQATDTMETNGLRTIFFGGGTPSLIPPDLLAQILDCLQSKFKQVLCHLALQSLTQADRAELKCKLSDIFVTYHAKSFATVAVGLEHHAYHVTNKN